MASKTIKPLSKTAQRKKMLKELDDVVKFYGKDPMGRRAVRQSNGWVGCTYEDKHGRRCAVGRRLCKKGLEEIKSAGNINDGVYTIANDMALGAEMDRLLKPSARGLSIYFWSKLQSVHDIYSLWDLANCGLSAKGQEYVDSFRDAIKRGHYDL